MLQAMLLRLLYIAIIVSTTSAMSFPTATVSRRKFFQHVGIAAAATTLPASAYDSIPTAASAPTAKLAAEREKRKQILREKAAKKNAEATALADKVASATTAMGFVDATDALSAWIVGQGAPRTCIGACQWLTADDVAPLPEGFKTRELVASIRSAKEALPQIAYACEMTRTNKGICFSAGKQAEAAYQAFLAELKTRAPLQYDTPYGPVSF